MTEARERGRTRFVAAVVSGLIFVAAAPAAATSIYLSPNEDLAVPSSTTASEPSLAGPIIHDRLVPFAFRDAAGGLVCSGNLQNRVVRSSITGRLDFYYRIRDTRGRGVINGIETSGFGGRTVRIAYRNDGLGTIPASRAFRYPEPGDVIVVGLHNAALLPLSCASHQESRFVVIRTRARLFETGGTTEIGDLDGHRVIVETQRP